jgi:hypothetical protein
LEHLPKALTMPTAVIGFIPYYLLKFALTLTLFVAQATLLVSALLLTAVGSGIKIGVSSALGLSYKPQLDAESYTHRAPST